jgi:putative ABC transport system permease protein
MKRAALTVLWSHWRRNPLQLFTLLAGLALATALWSGVQAINAEARASYDAAAATLGEGQFDQLVASDRSPIPQATYIALRRGGWLVSPVIEGRLNGVRLVGLEPLTAPGGLGPVEISDGADVTAFLGGQGQIFGRAEVLAELAQTEAVLIEVADMAPGTAITDIGVAQRLLGMPDQITRLMVAKDQPSVQRPLTEIAPDLVLRKAEEDTDVGRLTDSFHLNLTAFGFLAFAVGIFIVHGAIGLAFEQRRPVVRTLRALGLPLRTLVGLMGVELLLIGLTAGAVGIGLGYVMAAALLPDVAATLSGLYGAEVAGTLSLRPAWWLSGLVIAVGGTAVAAAGALWGLARMPLLASAQPRAWAMGSGRRGALWQAIGAGILIGAALVLLVWGSGLVAAFGLLACLLIGTALALPILLDRVLAFGERLSSGVLRQWFWADSRQQLPGLSLALAALLLAMAANVGVSTMVSSFRLTFTGFLDQRLASELYVVAADNDEAQELVAFVTPRVDAVLPLLSVERDLAGVPGAIFAARDHQTYRDNWRFLEADPQVWDRLAAESGVIINEQLSRRAGLGLGDPFLIAEGAELPVIGIYGDYGNTSGQAIITESLFIRLFPDVYALRFGLRIEPAKVPDLTIALTQDFGLDEAAIIHQTAIKAFSLEVFERTFTVTAALNVLTLAVAGFAMLMSLLTLAGLRVPQLAPVWALGLTRRALGQIELLRACLLAGLTMILALPLGLALAWVLLAIVNVEAFGWRLPMYLFPLDYARLAILALGAAFVAALWPALRLARTPPAALLKVFSHER